jgi:serine/threonine protein kinase
MLNDRREEHCIAVTPERKYYRVGQTFIKRSLRPSEWQTSQYKGTLHVPRQARERLLNEAAVIEYISAHTNIPVPALICVFEDDEAVYLVTQYVEGVAMSDLDDAQRAIVGAQLEEHLTTMSRLRSKRLGGPTGLVVPPYRVSMRSFRDQWNLTSEEGDDFGFCHNDLSQQNIIVDPDSLMIKAIIDWEYAGFYPSYVERRYFKRLGPSVALAGEEDDRDRLVDFLESRRGS